MDHPNRTSPSIWRKHRLSARNFTVFEYVERGDLKYDLTPPYQRGSVWTLRQRQALIRSLLMGVPIGALVMNQRGYDPVELEAQFGSGAIYAVVDGRQRIETLRAFVHSEFAVPADWWEDEMIKDWPENGMVVYAQLSAQGRRAFENLPVQSLVASVPTLEDEAEIFLLINRAGTAQDDESVARAEGVARG